MSIFIFCCLGCFLKRQTHTYREMKKKNWRKRLIHLILIILEQTVLTEDSHRNPQCFANRVKLKNRKFNCILCFLSNLPDLAQSTKTPELCATLFFFELTLFKFCLHLISFLHVKVILQTTDAAQLHSHLPPTCSLLSFSDCPSAQFIRVHLLPLIYLTLHYISCYMLHVSLCSIFFSFIR